MCQQQQSCLFLCVVPQFKPYRVNCHSDGHKPVFIVVPGSVIHAHITADRVHSEQAYPHLVGQSLVVWFDARTGVRLKGTGTVHIVVAFRGQERLEQGSKFKLLH